MILSIKDFLIVSYLLQDKRKCTSFSTLFTITATACIEDYQPVWSAKNNNK